MLKGWLAASSSRVKAVQAKEHEANISHYERRYREGYGLGYPGGHAIRFHRQILEYVLQHIRPAPVEPRGAADEPHAALGRFKDDISRGPVASSGADQRGGYG